MADFDRKALRKIFEDAEIEVPKDVLGQICNLHTDSLDGMNDTIKDLKKDLKKAEQERDDLQAKIPKEGEETISKSEYDKLQKQYDDYKADITAKETKKAKDKAVREYFEGKNIRGNNLELAMRGCTKEVESLELEDNKIKDTASLDALVDGIFSSLAVATATTGVQTATPPAGNPAKPEVKSRAAELANQYHRNLYGEVKK